MDTDTNDKPAPDASTPEQPVAEVPATPTQTPVATETLKRRRSPKMIIAGAVAAIIVLLAAGSALGYTMWYQNPDKVVHDAIMNAIQAKTMHSTGTITYKSDEITADISLTSAAGDGNGEFTVDAKVAIDSGDMQQDFNAKGAGKMVDGTLYVKLSGIRDVVEDVTAQSNGQIPDYASSIFDKIDDKWISIAPSDYQDIDESISAQQKCITDLVKKAQSDKVMMREVTDLYKKNQIVTIKEQLGTKDVAGVSSLGYKIEADSAKATAFVEGLENTALGKELKQCDDSINFKEIVDDLSTESTDSENAPTMELWVSKFGHTITQFSVYGTEDNNTINVALQPTFNKNVTVEVPTDATPLKTILEDIQQAILESYSGLYSDDMMMQESMLSEFESET